MQNQGLFDYIARHSEEQPQAIQEESKAAKTYRERLEETERAQKLKDRIVLQLEKGNAPQDILYTAIEAIELLTGDAPWAEACRAKLEEIYSDLAQQSMLFNEAEEAAARLAELQNDYNKKLKRDLELRLSKNRRIEQKLTEALAAVNAFYLEE